MSFDDRYPDRPETASDGEEFARLCIELHRRYLREDVGYHETSQEQFDFGESALGVEFKHLQKSHHRFRIEVAERTSLHKAWVPSGIFAKCKRYCCGNTDDIWCFDVRDLRQMANHQADLVWRPELTILSFELEKLDAMSFYRYRFIKRDDGYELRRRGFAGYDGEGHFVHYCAAFGCGVEAGNGYGVSLLKDRFGTWYCSHHKPKEMSR